MNYKARIKEIQTNINLGKFNTKQAKELVHICNLLLNTLEDIRGATTFVSETCSIFIDDNKELAYNVSSTVTEGDEV